MKAVNTERINLYWQVGEYISRRIAATSWGEKTVDELAAYLIKGNNYRKVARVSFQYKSMMIKFVGTHAEYDKVDAATV